MFQQIVAAVDDSLSAPAATAAYLGGMWGCWDRVSYDSSVAALMRERDGIQDPSAALAQERYAGFGAFRGLACVVDLRGYFDGRAPRRPWS